jgi:urease alpha subunit
VSYLTIEVAQSSIVATIPQGLFDSINTENGTNFDDMFLNTFFNFGVRPKITIFYHSALTGTWADVRDSYPRFQKVKIGDVKGSINAYSKFSPISFVVTRVNTQNFEERYNGYTFGG